MQHNRRPNIIIPRLGAAFGAILLTGTNKLGITRFETGGGQYGKHYRIGNNRNAGVIRLTPGTHKTLMPDFDYRRSRWILNVLPQFITRLVFWTESQTQIALAKKSLAA